MYVLQAHWYPDTQSGDFFHRIQVPQEAVNQIEPGFMQTCSIYHSRFFELACKVPVLLLHLVPNFEIGLLIQWRKDQGLATVFEIPDHFLAIESWTSGHVAYRNPEIRQNLLFHAWLAEGRQFSTDFLAKTYELLGPGPVFRNVAPQVKPQMSTKSGFHFGWAGSQSHGPDLMAWLPAIKTFLKRDQVAFHFMGDRALFKAAFPEKGKQVHYYPPSNYAKYLAFYSQLHVGLGPMNKNAFNAGRSDGKFLELASCGCVAVLEDFMPFQKSVRHGENGYLCKGPEAVLAILNQLYDQPDLIQSVRENAFKSIQSRNSAQSGSERLKYYRSLARSNPPVAVAFDPGFLIQPSSNWLEWARKCVRKGPHPWAQAVLAENEQDEELVGPMREFVRFESHQRDPFQPIPHSAYLQRLLDFVKTPNRQTASQLLAENPFYYQALIENLMAFGKNPNENPRPWVEILRILDPDNASINQIAQALGIKTYKEMLLAQVK
ncbi:MAG: glycosyltransferase [Acidobacteria bacterium]|nr:glycosyltransferase [Acidobacteriota bacterium]